MDIDDLYYGIKVIDPNTHKLVSYNLFDSGRVKRSVAMWRTLSKKERRQVASPLSYCFGSVRGRVEWEMAVTEPFNPNPVLRKYDVYEMYVEPNAGLLMLIVDMLKPRSARKWLKEHGE